MPPFSPGGTPPPPAPARAGATLAETPEENSRRRSGIAWLRVGLFCCLVSVVDAWNIGKIFTQAAVTGALIVIAGL